MKNKTSKPAPKRGFYDELFTLQERRLLEKPVALEEEEKLLRIRVRRLAKRMLAGMDLKDELGSITALARMIQMIATLERVGILVYGKGGEVGQAVMQALSEMDPYEEL